MTTQQRFTAAATEAAGKLSEQILRSLTYTLECYVKVEQPPAALHIVWSKPTPRSARTALRA